MSRAYSSLVGQNLGRYKVVDRLGSGGMGIVYKALDEKLNRHVALKFLPADLAADRTAREMLLFEARAASALDHPNIGVIYGIEETPEADLFIVMGFYDGQTLASRVREGPLGPSLGVSVAAQMARGLAEAHSRNI